MRIGRTIPDRIVRMNKHACNTEIEKFSDSTTFCYDQTRFGRHQCRHDGELGAREVVTTTIRMVQKVLTRLVAQQTEVCCEYRTVKQFVRPHQFHPRRISPFDNAFVVAECLVTSQVIIGCGVRSSFIIRMNASNSIEKNDQQIRLHERSTMSTVPRP